MSAFDEPVLGDDDVSRSARPENDVDVQAQIARLVTEQRYGVLCTQSREQPYGSMIAIAFTEDLSTAVFATSRFTRKYHVLSTCNKVALVINNREKYPEELHKIEAITVTGRAEEITDTVGGSRCITLLTKKHPYLKSFILSPSTSVFRVAVVRYFYVHRFQEVREWAPPARADQEQE